MTSPAGCIGALPLFWSECRQNIWIQFTVSWFWIICSTWAAWLVLQSEYAVYVEWKCTYWYYTMLPPWINQPEVKHMVAVNISSRSAVAACSLFLFLPTGFDEIKNLTPHWIHGVVSLQHLTSIMYYSLLDYYCIINSVNWHKSDRVETTGFPPFCSRHVTLHRTGTRWEIFPSHRLLFLSFFWKYLVDVNDSYTGLATSK